MQREEWVLRSRYQAKKSINDGHLIIKCYCVRKGFLKQDSKNTDKYEHIKSRNSDDQK